MKLGRPPMYKKPEDMQIKIDEYMSTKGIIPVMIKDDDGKDVQATDKYGDPIFKVNAPTVTGMALYLGFCNRCSMYEYQENKLFTDTIKRAIAGIEAFAEERLYDSKPTGAIFWLKNHGWKDKQEVEQSGTVDNNIKITFG